MRWSHSRSQQYGACGEWFRLDRIEQVPQRPTIYRVFGSAFHTWTEMYDRGEQPTDWDSLLTWYVTDQEETSGFHLAEWDNPNPMRDANQKAFEKFRGDFGLGIIDGYVSWRKESGWQIATDLPPDEAGSTVGIEYELTYTVGEVEVKAYIDRLFTNGALVDMKTGTKLRPSPQLPSYMVGARQRGINVTHGAYYEARKGTLTALNAYPGWDEQRLAVIYEQQAKQQAAGIYIPRPSEDCSTFCSVRRHCAFAI